MGVPGLLAWINASFPKALRISNGLVSEYEHGILYVPMTHLEY